jgi:hypothetical protein
MRFQFSLAWLLIVVTAVAIVLGMSASFTAGVVHSLFISIVSYVLPATLLASAIYGRGDYQAFAIGALIPCTVVGMTWIFNDSSRSPSVVGDLAMAFHVVIWGAICGLLSTATRRWVRQHDQE